MKRLKRIGEYTRNAYEKFVTNSQRAEAAFAIEQGVRAIDRYFYPPWYLEQRSAVSAIEQGLRALERFSFIKIVKEYDYVSRYPLKLKAAFAIEQGLRALERIPRPMNFVSRWPRGAINLNSIYGKTLFFGQVVSWTDYEQLWTIQAIEQFVRALDRWKIPTCIEHGCQKSKCAGQYHANDKTRHGVVVDPYERCWCGLTREAHVMPERDFRPRPKSAAKDAMVGYAPQTCEVKS